MSDTAKPAPSILGLPRVTIEIVEITPEQRKKGEQGNVRVVEDTNSWVTAMPGLLLTYLRNTNIATIRDTLNQLINPNAIRSPKLGALGSAVFGVQAGTGVTAVDRDDHTLDTLISNGSTAGRLVYDAVGALTKSTAITGGYRVQVERNFQNDSGGDITVNETGLFTGFRNVSADQSQVAMILRDLISPGHLVSDGGAVIIRYLLDWLA